MTDQPTPLTVACVWVRGNVPFTAEYVTRLRQMVRSRLNRQYRFVCLTDRPEELPQVNTIKIDPLTGCAGWWNKIQLFSPANEFQGRVLYLDLDVLIPGSLDEIVDYPANFALVPHAGTFVGRKGLRVIKAYNSSVMVWNASERSLRQIFTMWRPHETKTLWGDQDWIAAILGTRERTMPLEWFPRLSEVKAPPWPSTARVILCKRPKNHEATRLHPWFDGEWGGRVKEVAA